MGGSAWTIGNNEMIMMDYALEGIPKKGAKTKAFFDTYQVGITIRNCENDTTEEEIKVACSELFEIRQRKNGKYDIDWEHVKCREWFFDRLRNDAKVIIYPIIELFTNHSVKNYFAKTGKWPTYYLSSEIYDEAVILTTKKKAFEITELAQLDWLAERGFTNG